MVGSLKYRLKKPLKNLSKVKHIKWLLPGWVLYEYYKTSKIKGNTTKKSLGQAIKAESVRMAAFASLPIPGTYEITTTGLAAINKKISEGKIKNFTLKAFRDFIPIRRKNNNLAKKIYFKIFYRRGQPYFKILRKNRNNL